MLVDLYQQDKEIPNQVLESGHALRMKLLYEGRKCEKGKVYALRPNTLMVRLDTYRLLIGQNKEFDHN